MKFLILFLQLFFVTNLFSNVECTMIMEDHSKTYKVTALTAASGSVTSGSLTTIKAGEATVTNLNSATESYLSTYRKKIFFGVKLGLNPISGSESRDTIKIDIRYSGKDNPGPRERTKNGINKAEIVFDGPDLDTPEKLTFKNFTCKTLDSNDLED